MKRYKATRSGYLCAEWVDYMDAYRIFEISNPGKTIAYEDDLGNAGFYARELGYDEIILVDSTT